MKPQPLLTCFGLLLLGGLPQASCQAADELPESYRELAEFETVSEIMRHLYRWYLDHADIEHGIGQETFDYYVLPQEQTLDAGDQSLFARIFIPDARVAALMKKTHYRIEELGIDVASESFKIVSVERMEAADTVPETAVRHTIPLERMLTYLFNTRMQADPMDDALKERLSQSARQHLIEKYHDLPGEGDLTFYVAPLSPLANEIWVFWQDARLLIRWRSDIDITRQEVWEHEHLAVKYYDIEEQTVLSFAEVPGSNAYLTRDQVGRILYNCTVYGQKLPIPRPAE